MKKRSGFGWLEILTGVLMIFLGLFTVFHPHATMTSFVRLYALIAILTGICDIVFFVKTEKYTGFVPLLTLITGILSVMSGIALFFYPNAGKFILSLLFPIWFISHCLFRLFNLPLLRALAGRGRFYFSLTVNSLGLVLGLLMILHPAVTIFTVGSIVGTWLVVSGIDSIMIGLSRLGSGW